MADGGLVPRDCGVQMDISLAARCMFQWLIVSGAATGAIPVRSIPGSIPRAPDPVAHGPTMGALTPEGRAVMPDSHPATSSSPTALHRRQQPARRRLADHACPTDRHHQRRCADGDLAGVHRPAHPAVQRAGTRRRPWRSVRPNLAVHHRLLENHRRRTALADSIIGRCSITDELQMHRNRRHGVSVCAATTSTMHSEVSGPVEHAAVKPGGVTCQPCVFCDARAVRLQSTVLFSLPQRRHRFGDAQVPV